MIDNKGIDPAANAVVAGRSLGPIATMPADIRRAMYLLALQLVRKP